MKVVQIPVGDMASNVFIVFKEGESKAFLVDAGGDFEKIKANLGRYGIEEVTHILLTHGHFDHIAALAQLKQETGAKVAVHARDASMLQSDRDNLGVLAGVTVEKCGPDIILQGGETLSCAGLDVTVLHTPGHSGGSVCYIAEGALFSGDTLFYMYCGRTDFPGSDEREYRRSLHDVLGGLKQDYTVYAGHGVRTTLSAEFQSNPYLAE
jgi:Zn-dependent hydrolases, including glyoxylases